MGRSNDRRLSDLFGDMEDLYLDLEKRISDACPLSHNHDRKKYVVFELLDSRKFIEIKGRKRLGELIVRIRVPISNIHDPHGLCKPCRMKEYLEMRIKYHHTLEDALEFIEQAYEYQRQLIS